MDAGLFEWIVAHRVARLDDAMWMLSVVSRGGMLWLAVGIVLTVLRRLPPRALAELALAIALATLTADHVLKPIVQRQRPFDAIDHVAVIGNRPNDSSLPSGQFGAPLHSR